MNFHRKNPRAGFTLIELMAAMFVSMVIIGLSGVSLHFLTQTIQKTKKPLSSSDQARVVMELLRQDLSNMFVRQDMSYLMPRESLSRIDTGVKIQFYSDVISSNSKDSNESNRGISCLGYGFVQNKNRSWLFRVGEPLQKIQNNFFGIIPASGKIVPLIPLDETPKDLISDGVLRIGFEYLIKPQPNLPDRFLPGKLYRDYPPRSISSVSELDQNFDPSMIHSIWVTILVADSAMIQKFTEPEIKAYTESFERDHTQGTLLDRWTKALRERPALKSMEAFHQSVRVYSQAIRLKSGWIKETES